MEALRTLQAKVASWQSNGVRLLMPYLTVFLADLVVLNLLDEYWSWVQIDSFTVSLGAAAVLLLMLKLTVFVGRRVARCFESSGRFVRFMRVLCTWGVLFGSKFVIVLTFDILFGESVEFSGPLGGVLVIICLAFVMLGTESALLRFSRPLV